MRPERSSSDAHRIESGGVTDVTLTEPGSLVSNDAVREMPLETMKRGRQILGEVLRLGQMRGDPAIF
jgi:hypothetical protein